ncbi:hypothetical protein SteCoe_6600 [Stentor coeruleus]|uniref:Uncharacterized protein n=1 Tax=Stentor coeruleus TaxID=5963 RepID=A0A1R2CPL0_9CILI|nr:hypothetical protein SteCoe_6600 [Stentor coeruleus]
MDRNSWEVFESVFSDKFLQTSSEVHSLVSNESVICIGLRNGIIQIYDLDTEEQYDLKGHNSTINALCLDGLRLISGGQDSNIIFWDLENRIQEASLPAHVGVITSLSLYNGILYSSGVDCKMNSWNINSIEKTGEVIFESFVCSMKISDGSIFVGLEDGNVEVFDMNLNKMKTFCGHLDAVWCIDCFADIMVTCSYDGTIRLWDIQSTNGRVIGEHDGVVNKVAIFDPSTAGIPLIISVGSDCLVKLWALDNLKETIEFHTAAVSSLAVFDMYFITGGFDNKVRIWSLLNLIKQKTLIRASDNIVDFVPVSNTQIATVEKGSIFVNSSLFIESNMISAVSVSDDGKILIVSEGSAIKWLDLATKKEINSINIGESSNSLISLGDELFILTENFTFKFSQQKGLENLMPGGKSLDINSRYIAKSSEKLDLYDKFLNKLGENQGKYLSIMFSKNAEVLYAATESSIVLLSLPGLLKLCEIQSFRSFKHMKGNGQGNLACYGKYLCLIPQYEIEKQIMLPD